MGSVRRRNSTRRRKGARPAKHLSRAGRPPSGRLAVKANAIPAAIGNAIEDQRRALVTAITLLHCLHLELRRQTRDGGDYETEAVKNALGWVELPDMTAMLLVQLHSVHLALDSVSLKRTLKTKP